MNFWEKMAWLFISKKKLRFLLENFDFIDIAKGRKKNPFAAMVIKGVIIIPVFFRLVIIIFHE